MPDRREIYRSPNGDFVVPRPRAGERSCFHHSPAQRSFWWPAIPRRVGRVPAQRKWAGTTSIVALDRNTGGGATLCLKVPKAALEACNRHPTSPH